MSILVPIWPPSWTKNPPKIKKVSLKTDVGKTVEKYMVSGRKSKPPDSKNVAKTMEDCSKSHFPHFRNEVEKTTLRDLILERFWEGKSITEQEKPLPKVRSKNQ